jgi:hypothetical protein
MIIQFFGETAGFSKYPSNTMSQSAIISFTPRDCDFNVSLVDSMPVIELFLE